MPGKPSLNNIKTKLSIYSNIEIMEKLNNIKPETTDKCIAFDIISVYSSMSLDEATEKVKG